MFWDTVYILLHKHFFNEPLKGPILFEIKNDNAKHWESDEQNNILFLNFHTSCSPSSLCANHLLQPSPPHPYGQPDSKISVFFLTTSLIASYEKGGYYVEYEDNRPHITTKDWVVKITRKIVQLWTLHIPSGRQELLSE